MSRPRFIDSPSARPAMEALLGAAVDGSPVAIYMLDLQGRVQLWNRAAEQLFGWSESDVIGLPDPTGAEPRSGMEAPSSSVNGEAVPVPAGQTELRRTASGEGLSVLVLRVAVGDPEGRPLGTVVNAVPTSFLGEAAVADGAPRREDAGTRQEKRRATAERVRRYRASRRGLRARERLLAVVSHDLRNSLATVLLNASAIIDSPAAQRVEKGIRDQLEWIARSAEQMNRLIADLLDVSAIESGRLALEPGVHSAHDLLLHTVEMHRILAAEQRIELRLRVEEGLPDLWADAQRVQQVLGNLLGNAIKFSPTGSVIELTAAAEGREAIRFTVSDQGVGIEPQHLPDIFELYWRRRTSRTGAGLGLAIAKGIVEGHGGQIWATSIVGDGSRFSFTVPTAGVGVPYKMEA